MAEPSSSNPPAKRRGRPPSPDGPKPQAEVQRAYRARLAAAGKVVKLIDPAAIPDPAAYADMRERLRNALLELELRQEDCARLAARNAERQAELNRLERDHTTALKDIILLKQRLAEPPEPGARTRRQRREASS